MVTHRVSEAQMVTDDGGLPEGVALVCEVRIGTPAEAAAFDAAMKSGALDDVLLLLPGGRWRLWGEEGRLWTGATGSTRHAAN